MTVELQTKDGVQNVLTDKEGYAFDIPDDLESGTLTFRKEGYYDETVEFTLAEADFESSLITMDDVYLEKEPHPYAVIVEDYEATYGAAKLRHHEGLGRTCH